MPRFENEVRELLAGPPGGVLDRTYGRESRGETDDPDYLVAQGEYMRACVVRTGSVSLDPALMCVTTFRTMIGHADYHVSGSLKDWDIFDKLDRIRIPTLVLGGELDECVPAHLADIAGRIPDAEHITQPGAAHMGYLEAEPLRREYVSIIRDFLVRIEARNRCASPAEWGSRPSHANAMALSNARPDRRHCARRSPGRGGIATAAVGTKIYTFGGEGRHDGPRPRAGQDPGAGCCHDDWGHREVLVPLVCRVVRCLPAGGLSLLD